MLYRDYEVSKSFSLSLTSTRKRFKIAIYYILDTCLLRKYNPHVKLVGNYIRNLSCVFFISLLHTDDVISLFLVVFCAHSQLIYTINLRDVLNIRILFSRVKINSLPLDIKIDVFAPRVIFSTYVTPV